VAPHGGDAGPLAWWAGHGTGAGASITFLSFPATLLAIQMLAMSPRESTGRSPKATTGLLLWFRGDDGGEQSFACGRWGVWRERWREAVGAAMGTRLWGVLWAMLTPRLSPGWVWVSTRCAKDCFSSFDGDGQVKSNGGVTVFDLWL